MNARALALTALYRWRGGRQFADAILRDLLVQSAISAADRHFATELFYGVLRNLTMLDFWISLLRETSVDASSRDLLRLGLFQLFILRTPGHAAVFETVALAGKRQRGLVNAVLRSALRRTADLDAAAAAAPLSVRTSHPEFLIDRWTRAFGGTNTEALCEWNNQAACVYARVNTLKISLDEFLSAQVEGETLPGVERFVAMRSIPSEALARGECYIQDPSTRIACELLDPQPGTSVLDACAAPGGKSGLLAQMMQNRGELVACDHDPSRAEVLSENLRRLGVKIARTLQHDWQSGPLQIDHARPMFDRILIDAPCTNTGVMRRRVDLRWRLAPADFLRMQKEQLDIVTAVLPSLKVGAALVYSTCSIEREENEEVVSELLHKFPELKLVGEQSALPFRDQFDGAYAARFLRQS